MFCRSVAGDLVDYFFLFVYLATIVKCGTHTKVSLFGFVLRKRIKKGEIIVDEMKTTDDYVSLKC